MIKPLIKTNPNKISICSSIIEKFPQDYEQMRYIEPFIGNGCVLLNKAKSQEEVVSDIDPIIISIWRVLRDENKIFKTKIGKAKYTEKYFNFIKNKKFEEDYLRAAFVEFVVRKMSKNGSKEVFEPIERKKVNRFWKEISVNISAIEERIKDVYFVSRKPVELIDNFSNQNTFCFCSPPPLLDDNKSKMTMDDYVNLTDLLKSFRGKVVFYGNNCSFYRRVFSEWKIIKRKNSKKNDFICVNF